MPEASKIATEQGVLRAVFAARQRQKAALLCAFYQEE
jgi:hypothetical protein